MNHPFFLLVLLLLFCRCGTQPEIPFYKDGIERDSFTVGYDDFKDTTAVVIRYRSDAQTYVRYMYYIGEIIPDSVMVAPDCEFISEQ